MPVFSKCALLERAKLDQSQARRAPGLGSGDGQALGQQSVEVLQQLEDWPGLGATGALEQKTGVAGPGLLLLFRPSPFPQPLPLKRAGLSPGEPRVQGVPPRPAPGMSLHLIF